jgi:hypothetical protein
MKSIKEKAEEFHKVIRVINEHESIVNTQGSKMFVEGANYVLEVVESILEDKELSCEETYDKIYATIKQLKK